jgi:hypothetical protein
MGKFFMGKFFMGMSWYLEMSGLSMAAWWPVGSRFARRNKAGFTAPADKNRATKNRLVKPLETSTRPAESGMFKDIAGRT